MPKRVVYDAGCRRSDTYMPDDAEPLTWIAYVLKDAPTATSVGIVDVEYITREQAGNAPAHRRDDNVVSDQTLLSSHAEPAVR